MPTPRPSTWDDLQILGSARPGASAPTLAVYRGGIYGLEFSASATNEIHGSIELPHAYKEGSDLVPHVHFATKDTTAAGGGVVFGLEYTLTLPTNGAAGGAPTTITATKAIPASNVQYQNFNLDLGTISGAGLKISTLIRYRFFRLGGDGADTFPATVFPSSVAIHYQSDSDGSTAQNSKY